MLSVTHTEISQSSTGIVEESNFQNVRANNYLRDLDPTNNTQSSTCGYIVIGSIMNHATANVDSSLQENLISQELAMGYDLEINPLDSSTGEDDINWITFKDGQWIRKVGVTVFQWSQGHSSHRRPFSVHCWVYEYNQRPLVFGQPFLETKKRRWSRVSNDNNDKHERVSSNGAMPSEAVNIRKHTSVTSLRAEGNVHKLRRSRRL